MLTSSVAESAMQNAKKTNEMQQVERTKFEVIILATCLCP